MSDDKSGLSRRTVLARGALAAGAVAMSGLLTRNAEAQAAKATKEAASYQEKSAKADQQCSTCVHFNNGACALVEGAVAPGGWCALYTKK